VRVAAIAAVLIVVVGAAALVAGPLRGRIGGDREAEARVVRTEAAARATLVERVSAPGEVRPHTRVEIRAEVSARILELPFREGDRVRAGDVVCRLDDRELQAQLASAVARRDGESFRLESDRARLAGTRARLEYAQRELERVVALHATGDVAQKALDEARERVEDLDASVASTEYALAVVESGLAAAEAEVDRVESSLANTVIASPMDGLVTGLSVEVGEVVTGSFQQPGTVLMTIADLSRMIHYAEIAESDVAKVRVGSAAEVRVNGYPDVVFGGTVQRIALQRSGAADGTGFFEAEIEIDLAGRTVRSGHVANSDIEIAVHEGVVVPYQSILARSRDEVPDRVRTDPVVDPDRRMIPVVFVVRDGRATMVPVEPGPSDLTHRVVERGLEPGDEVIAGPYKVLESIEDDAPVRIEGAASEAADAVAAGSDRTGGAS